MKKFRLDIDALVVESFASSSRAPAFGTVKGHNAEGGSYFDCTENAEYTCNLYRTCRQPCGFSDATNCHYCTENNTGVSYCPDGDTRCIC